jgi:hypothetical protein
MEEEVVVVVPYVLLRLHEREKKRPGFSGFQLPPQPSDSFTHNSSLGGQSSRHDFFFWHRSINYLKAHTCL